MSDKILYLKDEEKKLLFEIFARMSELKIKNFGFAACCGFVKFDIGGK